MKIAMVASEAAPFVKTGGLGDVLQALPQALSNIKNNEVSVFIPFYDRIKYSGKYDVEFLGYFDVPLAWRREYVGLLRLKSRRKKLKVYFIDNEHYFCRGCVYGCADDGERYAYFAKAALASMAFIGLQPDIIHCHDWQAALVPLLLKTEYHESFPNAKSVFTIHNIEYQGKANLSFNYDVIGLPRACDEVLRFDDCTNFMKAAIVTADQVSTVSQTYCQELRYPYYAHGMSQVLSSRGGDFTGITNGIDTKLFDPMTTEGLAAHYNEKTFKEGKLQNKLALQKTLGLPEDRDTAMLAMVTRLAGHKGIDLLCYIAERLMSRRVQLVVIGTGEEKYEWFLRGLQERFGRQVSVNLCFSADLANVVYAGADLYLMPSKSEPCGLSQLMAMRFGAVPVVNATGGLKDTVPPYEGPESEGRGFTFQSYNADDFLAAIDRIVGGLEKPNMPMTAAERRATAIHEAGHATVMWSLPQCDPVLKVTVVPRGRSLGATWYVPDERRIHVTNEALQERLAGLLGGRIAEEVNYGTLGAGALSDLERATETAYAMVAYYGMSKKIGPISYYDSSGTRDTFTKPFSEQTARDIDTEVRRIIEEAYAKARGIIERKSEQINRMADLLLEKETIYAEDIERILGPAAQVPREDDDPKKGVVVADDDAASGTAAAPPDAPTAGTGTTQEGDAGSASGTKTAASGAANAEKSELK